MHCVIRVGRLISHPCHLKAKARCVRCRKPTCPGHFSAETDADSVRLCVICAGEYTPPKGVRSVDAHEMFDFDADAFAIFEQRQSMDQADALYFDS